MDNIYPSGSALVADLINLHRAVSDDEVRDLIEAEIETEVLGMVPVAVPEERPVPNASIEELLHVHENQLLDKDVKRYIRLRMFELLGAFENASTEERRDEETVLSELSGDDLRYLDSIEDLLIASVIEEELTQRNQKTAE